MYPKWLWPGAAAPGVIWLVLLFLIPFYLERILGRSAAVTCGLATHHPLFDDPPRC